jgi:hypothetical protein
MEGYFCQQMKMFTSYTKKSTKKPGTREGA